MGEGEPSWVGGCRYPLPCPFPCRARIAIVFNVCLGRDAPLRCDDEASILQGHLSILQQVVQHRKQVALRLLQPLQHQHAAVKGSLRRKRNGGGAEIKWGWGEGRMEGENNMGAGQK
eukprot:scaffold9963_cov80-Isochrysis_galbana.AAC.4